MPLDAAHLRDLLNLYPLEVIRDRFPPTAQENTEAHLLRIIETEPQVEILRFCQDFFHVTKQHVHLFRYPHRLPTNQPLIDNNLFSAVNRNSHFLVHDLQIDTFILTDPPQLFTRHLPWPIKIEILDGVLRVRFVIMERSVENDGRQKMASVREFDEKRLVEGIVRELSTDEEPLRPLDINTGIKVLWEADAIDSMRAQWVATECTDIRTMNKGVFLKRQRGQRGRQVYAEILRAPLLKSVFAAFQPLNEHVNKFACDPTGGVLYFNRYSRNRESTDNVIREVLRANR